MTQFLPPNQSSVVVIGDGWSALGSVGFLANRDVQVIWVPNSGARLLSPLPSIETGPGVSAWRELVTRMGIDAGELQTGSFLREFRNKAFREPNWTKAPTPEMRREVRNECLWTPETRFVGAFETRFSVTWAEIEEALRTAVLSMPTVRRIDGVPVKHIEAEKDHAEVLLGSGEKIRCDRVIFADRWAALPGIEGLPKPLSFTRGREPMGALQASFTHKAPIGAGLMEGFFAPLHKEAGEEFQRHVFGYFSQDGMKSYWTVFLGAQEVEDNHEIAKKLRRMKQALEKMFTGTEWIPAEYPDFPSAIAEEHVRFEEAVVFAGGHAPVHPLHLPKSKIVMFMTDGYGPECSFRQVAHLLGDELGIPKQAEADWASASAEPAPAPSIPS